MPSSRGINEEFLTLIYPKNVLLIQISENLNLVSVNVSNTKFLNITISGQKWIKVFGLKKLVKVADQCLLIGELYQPCTFFVANINHKYN